jgi:hypothetical protein
MTQADKIEYLAGQVQALIAFAVAIISSHPDPELLAHHLDLLNQVTLASVENSLVADKYVQGVQDVQGRLTTAVETAKRLRANPSSA